MDEFSLINTFFKSISHHRDDVIVGIGDDAACLKISQGMDLVVSCDTLVEGIHFLSEWDPADIAYKAVMVNVSDMAAMGATPCWVTLALTLPSGDDVFLERFSQGLQRALKEYNIALIGGDTTRGPLTITLTIHGMLPSGQAVRRSGAVIGDLIYVSGELGAAALAVENLTSNDISGADKAVIMKKLLHPYPRIDLGCHLRDLSTAAIDISDGLNADLYHICDASQVGACLNLEAIPVHPLVKKYRGLTSLDFALSGGDDYELCFTVSPKKEQQLLNSLAQSSLSIYPIGVIDEGQGIRIKTSLGEISPLPRRGYRHF